MLLGLTTVLLWGAGTPVKCEAARGNGKKPPIFSGSVTDWGTCIEKLRLSLAFYLHPRVPAFCCWAVHGTVSFTQWLLLSGPSTERVKEVKETQIRQFANASNSEQR